MSNKETTAKETLPEKVHTVGDVLSAIRNFSEDDRIMVGLRRLDATKTVRTKTLTENGDYVPAPVTGPAFLSTMFLAGLEKLRSGKVGPPASLQRILDNPLI